MFLLGRGENVRASSLYLLRKLKGPDTAPQRALLSVVFASMGDEEEALRLASPEIKDEITHNFSNLALCILGREPLLGALTEPWVLTACSHVSPEYEPLAGYRRWLELRDSLPTQLEYQKSFVISWTAMRDRKTTGGEENVEASLEMLKLSPLESPEAKLHTYTNLAVSLMLLGDDRYQYYLDEVKRGTENEHAHLRVMAYQSLMEFYARTDDEQETMKMARELKRRASKVATWIMSKEPFNRSWLLREVSLNCLSLAKVVLDRRPLHLQYHKEVNLLLEEVRTVARHIHIPGPREGRGTGVGAGLKDDGSQPYEGGGERHCSGTCFSLPGNRGSQDT